MRVPLLSKLFERFKIRSLRHRIRDFHIGIHPRSSAVHELRKLESAEAIEALRSLALDNTLGTWLCQDSVRELGEARHPDAVEALRFIAQIDKGSDPVVATDALRALARRADAPAIAVLAQLIETEVRLVPLAAECLVQAAGKEAAPVLLPFLKSKDWGLYKVARKLLGQIGWQPGSLAERVDWSWGEVDSAAVVRNLVALGPEVVPLLFDQLANPEDEKAINAAKALFELRAPRALEAAIGLLLQPIGPRMIEVLNGADPTWGTTEAARAQVPALLATARKFGALTEHTFYKMVPTVGILVLIQDPRVDDFLEEFFIAGLSSPVNKLYHFFKTFSSWNSIRAVQLLSSILDDRKTRNTAFALAELHRHRDSSDPSIRDLASASISKFKTEALPELCAVLERVDSWSDNLVRNLSIKDGLQPPRMPDDLRADLTPLGDDYQSSAADIFRVLGPDASLAVPWLSRRFSLDTACATINWQVYIRSAYALVALGQRQQVFEVLRSWLRTHRSPYGLANQYQRDDVLGLVKAQGHAGLQFLIGYLDECQESDNDSIVQCCDITTA